VTVFGDHEPAVVAEGVTIVLPGAGLVRVNVKFPDATFTIPAEGLGGVITI
jgi:hypothetical protein